MQNKKNQLIKVEDAFDRNWQKIRKRVLQKVSVEDDENDEIKSVSGEEEDRLNKEEKNKEATILEKFEEEKFSIYLAHLK